MHTLVSSIGCNLNQAIYSFQAHKKQTGKIIRSRTAECCSFMFAHALRAGWKSHMLKVFLSQIISIASARYLLGKHNKSKAHLEAQQPDCSDKQTNLHTYFLFSSFFFNTPVMQLESTSGNLTHVVLYTLFAKSTKHESVTD